MKLDRVFACERGEEELKSIFDERKGETLLTNKIRGDIKKFVIADMGTGFESEDDDFDYDFEKIVESVKEYGKETKDGFYGMIDDLIADYAPSDEFIKEFKSLVESELGKFFQ